MTTKTVRVTSAKKQAAKTLVNRSAKTGRQLPQSVTKIANATRLASTADTKAAAS